MDIGTGIAGPGGLHYPAEPTAAEWRRWALESGRPGEVIRRLREEGEIGLYPEIAALVGVPQDPEWHPEGTVDVHVGHVLNAAAEIAGREALPPDERLLLIFAALTHDFGKPRTTRQRKVRGGLRWTSWEHERAGVPLAESFLRRLGMEGAFIRRVLPLVEFHMAYRWFDDRNAGIRTARRLAARLAPATIPELCRLIEADHSGRPPLPRQAPPSALRLLQLAGRLNNRAT